LRVVYTFLVLSANAGFTIDTSGNLVYSFGGLVYRIFKGEV